MEYAHLFSFKRDKRKLSYGNNINAAHSYQSLNRNECFSWYSQLNKNSTTHIAIRHKTTQSIALSSQFFYE